MKNNIVPVEVAQKVFSDSNLPCIGKAGIRIPFLERMDKLCRENSPRIGEELAALVTTYHPERAGV